MSAAERPTPAKMAVAIVSIAGALATVAFHLGLFDGAEAEAAASTSEGPIPLATSEEIDAAGAAGDELLDLDEAAGPAAPSDVDAAPSPARAPADTPDWRGMFEALMAREQRGPTDDDDEHDARVDERAVAESAAAAAQDAERAAAAARAEAAAARIAALALRGIVAEGGAGTALVDGHLVRVGDLVPGTRATVVEILRERIVVRHPDVGEPLDVHLAPFAASGGTGDPPGDGPPAPDVEVAPPPAAAPDTAPDEP